MSALMHGALRCASAGWPVIPCEQGGKRAITPNGLLDATTDPEQIIRWWSRRPHANLAVRTGEASGIVVLDVDGDDGSDSLYGLEREHGELPSTLSIVTPRGGAHLYFKWPGLAVKTTAGVIAAGIDIRGDGGYALIPPSCTTRGTYVVDNEVPPAAMPAWLIEMTRADNLSAGSGTVTSPRVWTTMLRDGIPDGQRNASLARLTGHLFRKWLDVELTAEIVHLVNAHRCRPPLSARAVDGIIDSIAAREAKRLLDGGR